MLSGGTRRDGLPFYQSEWESNSQPVAFTDARFHIMLRKKRNVLRNKRTYFYKNMFRKDALCIKTQVIYCEALPYMA